MVWNEGYGCGDGRSSYVGMETSATDEWDKGSGGIEEFSCDHFFLG